MKYVYHGRYSSTTELHLAEQISNMVAVEWLQYNIQMSSTLEAMAGSSVPPAQVSWKQINYSITTFY